MEKMTIPNKYFPQTEVKSAEIDILFTKAMRLNNGDQGMNKILTCINNNGLADWENPSTETVVTNYSPQITSDPEISNIFFTNFNAVRLNNIIKFNFDLAFDFSGFAGVEYKVNFSTPLSSSNFTQNYASSNWTQKSNGFAISSVRLESVVGSSNLRLLVNPIISGHSYSISVIGFVEII